MTPDSAPLGDQGIEIARMAGSLAHELKNPLSVIRMNMDLLAEDLAEGETQRDRRLLAKVQTVQGQCLRLQNILDDFLSFARAMARDPRILLLDEATSSVDSEAEGRIQRGVDLLMAGRTAIVVAHRLSTILHADEILVIHHGRVVERGKHHDLLTQPGVYHRLYHLQIGSWSA